MENATAGFWSYVHADDDASAGLIRELARQLQQQYRALTAEDLSLFLDSDELRWGDEWTRRIDDAIAGTTFFIPIITPSYFRSQECRRELLKFATEARRLGLEQLLMPVHWINVPELEAAGTEATDEAVALVARHHWQDLRGVWLEEPHSSAFRKAVNALATEVVKRVEAVAEIPTGQPGAEDHAASSGRDESGESHEDDTPGALDKLAAQEEAVATATQILEEIATEIVSVGEVTEKANQELEAASTAPSPVRVGLAITQKMARDLEFPAAKIEQLGHQYAAALMEIDPFISEALDQAAAEPGNPDREEFLQVMEQLAEDAEPALDNLRFLVRSAVEMGRFARSLRRPVRKMRTGLQGVIDGKAVIDEWARRAREIRGSSDAQGHGSVAGV